MSLSRLSWAVLCVTHRSFVVFNNLISLSLSLSLSLPLRLDVYKNGWVIKGFPLAGVEVDERKREMAEQTLDNIQDLDSR